MNYYIRAYPYGIPGYAILYHISIQWVSIFSFQRPRPHINIRQGADGLGLHVVSVAGKQQAAQQEALLCQRDSATRLSVDILQLNEIWYDDRCILPSQLDGKQKN